MDEGVIIITSVDPRPTERRSGEVGSGGLPPCGRQDDKKQFCPFKLPAVKSSLDGFADICHSHPVSTHGINFNGNPRL